MHQVSLASFPVASLAFALLAACSSPSPRQLVPSSRADAALVAELAAASPVLKADEGNAPKGTTMTAGIGVSDSPTSTLFAASYDVPVHPDFTVGPALHFAYDDEVDLFGAEALGRYFLPRLGESLQAYVNVGAGFGMVDKPRRDEDWGLLMRAGFGLRVKTSSHGMLSSEVNLFFLPEDLAGEESYVGWQVVQFVFGF